MTALSVAVIICVGLGLRVWLASLPLGSFDGDEATTGVMVRQILHGHFYVYMAGQDYNGAFEQYLQAVVWALGPQNVWTLRSVDFALYVVTAFVVYRCAASYFSDKWRPMTAVAIFCVGPYFNVWKSIHSHGDYASGQLVAAVSLLAAASIRRDSGRPARLLFVVGLTAGLAFWMSWTASAVVIPTCLWTLPAIRQRARRIFMLLLGALIGAAPAVGYDLANGQLPGLGGTQPHRTVAQRLDNLAEPLAREFLGLGYRYGHPGLPLAFQQVALIAVTLTFGVAFVKRHSALLGTLKGRWTERRPSDVLLFVPILVAIGYATSRYAWWTGEPRYLFTVYPALALGVPAVLRHRRPRAFAVGIAAVALAAASTITATATHADDGPADESGCLNQVAADLTHMGIDHVYSDYWTGMPLQMIAGDRLSVGPVSNGRAKFPYLRHAVDNDKPVYYLAGHIPDPMDEVGDNVATVKHALAAHHIAATETPLACTVLFSNFEPAVRPWQIGLGFQHL